MNLLSTTADARLAGYSPFEYDWFFDTMHKISPDSQTLEQVQDDSHSTGLVIPDTNTCIFNETSWTTKKVDRYELVAIYLACLRNLAFLMKLPLSLSATRLLLHTQSGPGSACLLLDDSHGMLHSPKLGQQSLSLVSRDRTQASYVVVKISGQCQQSRLKHCRR